MNVDSMPYGAPYAIGEALFAALDAASASGGALEGATLMNNPVRAADLGEGDRVVFFEDVSDGPSDKQSKRTYRYNVGVINRSEQARLGSHRDYRAAKRALKVALPRLNGTVQINSHREGEITFRLENIDVGGGLVLGTFTIEYSDTGAMGV